jgi:uncharacterized coiled-coil protein SlyX
MSEIRATRSSLAESNSELDELRALVVEQAATINQLRERIEELEARLAKDSHNSNEASPQTDES